MEETGFSVSEGVTIDTYADPGDIWDVDKGKSWLQIAWRAPEDDTIISHAFQYAEVRTACNFKTKLHFRYQTI